MKQQAIPVLRREAQKIEVAKFISNKKFKNAISGKARNSNFGWHWVRQSPLAQAGRRAQFIYCFDALFFYFQKKKWYPATETTN